MAGDREGEIGKGGKEGRKRKTLLRFGLHLILEILKNTLAGAIGKVSDLRFTGHAGSSLGWAPPRTGLAQAGVFRFCSDDLDQRP